MTTAAYMLRAFARWAKDNGLSSESLSNAVEEIEQGLVEARLGGVLYKKRIALQGRGKSGGARTIIAFRSGYRTFFLYGFEKNQRSNIVSKEQLTLKKLGQWLMEQPEAEIEKMVREGSLVGLEKGQ